MMLINNLLDKFKAKKGFTTDKQIAYDLSISCQKLSAVRQGSRFLTEKQLFYLSQVTKCNYELVILDLLIHKSKFDKTEVVLQMLFNHRLAFYSYNLFEDCESI